VFMMTSLTLSVKRAPTGSFSTGSILEQTQSSSPAKSTAPTPAKPASAVPVQAPSAPTQQSAPAPAPAQPPAKK
jgi:hypothetical protein